MQPDPRSRALDTAAKRKSQAARRRAKEALQALDLLGAQISFQAVAQAAGVSRQWLYTQPELRSEIEQLRAANDSGERTVPARERASENSLRHRNRVLLEDNQRLRAENAALKDELATALGELRAKRRASEREA
ncbi:MAG: DUF6262 family protein [Solirubrobacteraceae bacterium]|jgi:hypothetical protein